MTGLLGRWPRGSVPWLRAEQPRRVVDRDHLNRLGFDSIDDAIGPMNDFAERLVPDLRNHAARFGKRLKAVDGCDESLSEEVA